MPEYNPYEDHRPFNTVIDENTPQGMNLQIKQLQNNERGYIIGLGEIDADYNVMVPMAESDDAMAADRSKVVGWRHLPNGE